MEKTARTLLAENLRRLMDAHSLETPKKLAKVARWPAGRKKGELIAPRTIGYALDTREDVVPPVPSPSLDLIVGLAEVFGRQAWEMLVSQEQADQWIVTRLRALPQLPANHPPPMPMQEARGPRRAAAQRKVKKK